MTYEAWRINYQSSEHAARAAHAECERMRAEIEAIKRKFPAAAQADRRTSDLRRHLTPSLANFDELPDAAMVDIRTVSALMGRGRSTIWRDVKLGRFPAPVKMGPGCTRWNVGVIRRTLEATVGG